MRFLGAGLLLAVAAAPLLAKSQGLTSNTIGVYTWRNEANCEGDGFFPVDTEPECEAAGRALFNHANGCNGCGHSVRPATEAASSNVPRGCWKWARSRTDGRPTGALFWYPNGNPTYVDTTSTGNVRRSVCRE